MDHTRQVTLFFLVVLGTAMPSGETATALPVSDPAQPGPFGTIGSEDRFVTMPGSGSLYGVKVYYPGSGEVLDPSGAPYPVAMVSHGFLMPRESLFSYGELLASWGYVAVVPQRPATQFSHATHIEDIGALLDWLEAQDLTPVSRYFGKLDLQRVGLAGHSLGGKLSFGVAAVDARVRAVVGLDPVDADLPPRVTPDLMANLGVPFLVLGTDLASDSCAPAADNFRQFYNSGRAPKAEVTVAGGDHCGMLDSRPLGCLVCTRGSDTSRQRELFQRWMTAWFNRFVQDETGFETYIWGPEAQREVQAGAVALRYQQGLTQPTATPTGALSPTPVFSATPTLAPTATPNPTVTSTPDTTPQPTATPLLPQRENLPLAGYMTTRLRANEGGNLQLVAFPSAPAAVVAVEFGGAALGFELTEAGAFDPNDGWYGWSMHSPFWPNSAPILLELRATLTGPGQVYQHWPHLEVGP
jgi:dienelactone hydrolase